MTAAGPAGAFRARAARSGPARSAAGPQRATSRHAPGSASATSYDVRGAPGSRCAAGGQAVQVRPDGRRVPGREARRQQ
ncbi:hypothetical protein NKH77_31150 [Streptomyces sp. M19]